MKYISLAIVAFTGLSLATPVVQKRQNIDFAAYNAIPDLPDVAAPAGDPAPAKATYVASVVAEVAADAAVAATVVGSGSAAAVTNLNVKRSLNKRQACDPRTPGSGPAVNNPDTPEAFQAYAAFSTAASGAGVPVGYQRIITNGLAAAQDSTYMTYTMMSTYDTAGCAAFCQAHQGCNSFNLFYERDATVEPGSGCDSPASLTYIKCSIFGGLLTTSAAKNSGQWQSNFHVVIAGSNIYIATAPKVPAGFTGPNFFGNKTINAPTGYMGVQTFAQSQPYDPSVCAAACLKKSAFDMEQGLPSKSNPDICNFFVAYVLYKNGENGVFTCTYYNSAWSSSYATNDGQWDAQNNHYTVGQANGFSVGGAQGCSAQTLTATVTQTQQSVTTATVNQIATVTQTATVTETATLNQTATITQTQTQTATVNQTATTTETATLNQTITSAVTTTATQTATVTEVTTSVSTTTPPTPTQYRIAATVGKGKSAATYYLQDAVSSYTGNPHFLQMGADIYSGTFFQFSASTNQLVLPAYGLYSEQSMTDGYNIIYFQTAPAAAGYAATLFTLNPADMSVTVTNPTKKASFLQACCGASTYLALYPSDQGYANVTLKAVPA